MPSPSPQDAEKKDKSFQDFAGVNTQAVRQSIQDNEFAWLENAMPIGHGNLKVVPIQTLIATPVATGTCYYMQSANLSNVDGRFYSGVHKLDSELMVLLDIERVLSVGSVVS